MSQHDANASVATIEKEAARGVVADSIVSMLLPIPHHELIAQAHRQALLCPYPLPSSLNAPADNGPQQLLRQLVQGKLPGLEPISFQPVAVEDAALDSIQREAVAKALHTPDLCLIQGLPGTGKSRVIAEILIQAAKQGNRILLLAPSEAALDRILELTGTHPSVCALRCIGRSERLDPQSSLSHAFTYRERVRNLRANLCQRASQYLKASQTRCERRRQDEGAWAQLQYLAERRQLLDEQLRGLSERRDRLGAEVEEATLTVESGNLAQNGEVGFMASLREAIRVQKQLREQAEHQDKVAQNRLHAVGVRLESLASHHAQLCHLVEIRKTNRWWTAAWWRAMLGGNVAAKLAVLEKERLLAEAELRAVQQEVEQVHLARKAAADRYFWQRTCVIEQEVNRRRVELDEREKTLRLELNRLEEQWQIICHQLDPETPRPLACTHDAIESARLAWQQQFQQEEARLTFAEQWLGYLQALTTSSQEAKDYDVEPLPFRLADYVNLVAITTVGLADDEVFAEGVNHPVHFDLLVVEEAHQVSEEAVVKAARLANRWVLIGEPEASCPGGRMNTGGNAECRRQKAESKVRGLVPESLDKTQNSALKTQNSKLLRRLWACMHCDPQGMPYAWVQEGRRLRCRLRTLSHDEQHYIESEHLADFPDIELRICSPPQAAPCLVEVVFPPSFTIARAKQFIYKELQEAPLHVAASYPRWIDKPDRLAVCFTKSNAHVEGIALEQGVWEFVHQTTSATHATTNTHEVDSHPSPLTAAHCFWQTSHIEFDRESGWDRPRAEIWLSRHAGLTDLNRTAFLDVPYRMQPGLAAFVSDLLFDGAYRTDLPEGPVGGLCSDCASLVRLTGPHCVEFVPVPQPSVVPKLKTQNSKLKTQKWKGAGLELDLSHPCHRERLPVELRSRLPAQGLVNYQEAQAVTQAIRTILSTGVSGAANRVCQGDDKCFRQSSERSPAAGLHSFSCRTVIAVLALYEAQAELIRCLLDDAGILSHGGIEMAVGVPDIMRQRESLITIVSLTRSHLHRAVSFGDSPRTLALALTRTSCRLILFGDPGTLLRRSQWEKPLDHLDEIAAAEERRWVSRLVGYMQGQEQHSHCFAFRC